MIEFPLYTKDKCSFTKHLSKSHCLTVDANFDSIEISKQVNNTTCEFDFAVSNLVVHKGCEATKEEFETAYFRAIELTKEFI